MNASDTAASFVASLARRAYEGYQRGMREGGEGKEEEGKEDEGKEEEKGKEEVRMTFGNLDKLKL